MSEYTTITYHVEDHVGLLALNRPTKMNALSGTMLDELEHFWAERRHDLDTRVLIITGNGDKGFCGGLDIKQTWPEAMTYDLHPFYRFQVRLSRLLLAMRACPQPVIAAIHGSAVGAGLSMALASDLRVIATNTRFAAAYINIGLGGADMSSSYFLPRLIGAGRAYEFLLTGDFMDAATAFNLGLASRVVEREKILDEAWDFARRMLRKNPLGLRLTKEALNCNIDAAGLEQALQLEDRNQALCFATLRWEGANPDTK
jgi:enoyl-CoA hydratase/carnithine racemase